MKSNLLYWEFEPIESLSREKLIEIINYLSDENLRLTNDRNKWRECADASKYLLLEDFKK